MANLKDLLIEQMQDLLHAEKQLTKALPQMASAAKNPKLQEAFQMHLLQTEKHVERLEKAFEFLGSKAQAKPCRAMAGLIEEGKEVISEGKEKGALVSDLALITAAQKVEHYEISGYGSVRSLARLINQREVSRLLDHTLGEEESADFLLTNIAEPLLQEARMAELGASEDELALVKGA